VLEARHNDSHAAQAPDLMEKVTGYGSMAYEVKPFDMEQITMMEKLLRRIRKRARSAPTLMSLTQDDLKTILNSADIGKEWNACSSRLSDLCQIEDGETSAVNPGDRRALFYLARAFRPERVLEIGTHVGASTLHIGAALTDGARTHRLITVDIQNVNDDPHSFWRRAGLAKSPKQMFIELNAPIEVTFVMDNSRHFFANNKDTFDFIFLDGDHAAETVYDEIVSALEVINENGLIVLHDYFPGGRPLWSDGSVITGPFTATEKLRSTGAAIKIIPLGALPWPTKLRSNVTSLAVIAM
jgi:predicted O-methyltransferase YrrM